MIQRNMILTLGRDLIYLGAGLSPQFNSSVADMAAEHSLSLDEHDSIVYYRYAEGQLTSISAGIALAESSRRQQIPGIDYREPQGLAGLFAIPPGRYGFSQFNANTDEVILHAREELAEYLGEKELSALSDDFFLRTIAEDEREVYQILIPLA